jgi:large subunit ribosomal protein L35
LPKLKTHKGAAARFRITGTGKLRRMKRHQSHLRRKKPKSVRRLYKKTLEVSKGTEGHLKTLLPYGAPR